MDDSTQNRLLKKGFSLLSRRAYSRGELRTKLLKIADEKMVEAVIKRLEQLMLLNDDDYAYNFSLSRVGREGWGPEKIKDALIRRQVPASAISIALDRIRAEVGNDYGLAVYLNKYCGKKGLPEDSKSIRNLITHLRRRGYPSDHIYGALKHILPKAVKGHNETGD
ncbi:MAG: regulatory protein RecX [Acidobacteriota bacterium]